MLTFKQTFQSLNPTQRRNLYFAFGVTLIVFFFLIVPILFGVKNVIEYRKRIDDRQQAREVRERGNRLYETAIKSHKAGFHAKEHETLISAAKIGDKKAISLLIYKYNKQAFPDYISGQPIYYLRNDEPYAVKPDDLTIPMPDDAAMDWAEAYSIRYNIDFLRGHAAWLLHRDDASERARGLKMTTKLMTLEPDSAGNLAYSFYTRFDAPLENYLKAQEYFQYVDEADKGTYYSRLSAYYLYGLRETKVDLNKAKFALEKAVAYKFDQALIPLARLSWEDLDDQEGAKKALSYLHQADKSESDKVKFQSATVHYFRGVNPERMRESVIRLTALAESGYDPAMRELIKRYQSDQGQAHEGVSQDWGKALYWAKKRELKRPEDHLALAKLYLRNDRTVENENAAFDHMEMAEKAALPEARLGLALFYRKGLGTDQNYVLAKTLLLNVDKPFRAQADFWLGQMALSGEMEGVGETDAIKYFKSAAKGGFIPSLRALALVQKDNAKTFGERSDVFLNMKAAAEGRDRAAMSYLADFYESGFGVQKNKSLADVWRQKAGYAKADLYSSL